MQKERDSGSPGQSQTGTVTDCVDEERSEASPVRYRHKLGLLLVVAALVVIFDQLSKLWVAANRPEMELVPGFIDLVYVRNWGAAFGLLASHTELLIAIGIAGSIILLVFFHYMSPVADLGVLSFALLLGGAVGNLVDRIRFGYVVDFISVQFIRWPPFNIADASITVGIFALLYFFYRSGVFSQTYERSHRARG